MKMLAKVLLAAALAAVLSAGSVAGVEPSPFINFQGVLRDTSDAPLDGNFDMTFRFYDAMAGGNEILVDRHLTGGAGPVRVTGGLFSAVLGAGAVSDGGGPGVYSNLSLVFRDYPAVYLEIQVGGEVLSPRARIHAAAYALNSSHLAGKAPGEYLDTSSTAQTKLGPLTLDTSGLAGGTGLTVLGDTGARIDGLAQFGIDARAPAAGGHFEDSNESANANVAVGDIGISAQGNTAGGYFNDIDHSGEAYLGWGDYGVRGLGNTAGGRFEDLTSSGYALCAYGDYGVYAYGNTAGGYFKDANGSGYSYLGYGDYGLVANGLVMAASFQDANDTGYAYCGNGDYGVRGFGGLAGGYFEDIEQSGYAYLGYGDRGIWAKGTFAGGTFSHPDSVTFWADVATPTRKIQGTGTVSFVQNHPYERDKVIVYAAPEGDEVAVYTRGSARLENGVARVALGPTFALVANPDLGLTAHVTPRGDVGQLWVESVDTHELVVHGPPGADVGFDYVVYGLRIGFEDLAVVQPKDREALLPDAAAIAAGYGGRDDLRAYSAGARFRAMPGAQAIDTTRAEALRRAIDGDRAAAIAAAPAVAERSSSPRPESPAAVDPVERTPAPAVASRTPVPAAPGAVVPQEPVVPGALLPVSEAVDTGDVLVADLLTPGALRRGTLPADPRVVGVAAGPAVDGIAPVATYGVVPCRADAAYGNIRPGDLLASSPTPGHAMRAAGSDAGTILGKALEPLEAGTGTIRVLVMPR